MSTELIIAACLGIGLSAASGFRIFIPLLVASVAGKLGYMPLTDNFHWMAGWPAIVCFGTATIFEILAYYIPFVDNLLDTLTTPMAVIAGTLLTTSVLPIDQVLLKWVVGLIIGGGSAGVIQTGTSLLRLASSKTTAGTANPVLATGENAASFGTSITSIFLPVVTAIFILVLILYILVKWLGYLQKK